MVAMKGFPMTFAHKMAELRTAAALTQEKLSELTGIPLPTIRKMEQGATTKRINFSFVVAIASVLKSPLDDFAGCDDVKFDPPKPAPKKAAKKKQG